MQKKSNKTAHVLSLLTQEKEKQNKEEMPEQKQVSKNDSLPCTEDKESKTEDKEPKKLPLKRKVPEKKYPHNTPIIEVKDEKEDPISNLIKEELTKMLEDEKKKNDTPNASVKSVSAGQHQGEKVMQSDADKFLQRGFTVEKDTEGGITTHHMGTDSEDDDTELFCVNVVELILKDRIKEYMDMVGMCTCERCTKDTMAIALNNIQPKYVVTNKGRLLAQLDLYDKQLAAKFMVEVVKAGVMVKASPRH